MIGHTGGRSPRGKARHANAKNRSGFTLIEMSIAMSILMIGIVAVVSATSRLHSLKKATRENTIAQNALQAIGERMHSKAYYLASGTPETWAQDFSDFYAAGGGFGDTFDVRGLNVDIDEPAIGSIEVLVDETLVDAALGAQVGMPRDLNGDGDALDNDVTDSAHILPVLLTLRWRGQNGAMSTTHGFFVTSY